jgi:hypothetical protein
MKQPGAMIFAYRKFLFFSRAADIKLRDPLTELGVRRDKISAFYNGGACPRVVVKGCG